jgi:UDP-glucose 4-epimerase
MTVLVTGGAGYVGSHAVQELRVSGVPCVVLDNLSRGHRDLVLDAELIVGDVGDSALVTRVLQQFQVKAVMHFAAFAYVGESVRLPGMYYENNVAKTINLLNCMVRARVDKLVFSSTCATYGLPDVTPITEAHPQRPVNPYGASKLMVERILRDFDATHGLRSISLRYFNAAGADPSGRIGERHDPETHLIPIALQAALGLRDGVDVFGGDYPTPDGTCIRDYVHVCDLAQAHVLGLERLQSGCATDAFNLGNGAGFSVLEVLDAVERITGRGIRRNVTARRPGDPHALVGSADKAHELLGWRPRFNRLEAMIETAWTWHRRHPV